MDGVPMHAAENGWYWAGGTKWQQAEPVFLKKHLRCGEGMVRTMIGLAARGDRLTFDRMVENMKPLWKEEAEQVITQFQLTINED
jgi:hypothetical protein